MIRIGWIFSLLFLVLVQGIKAQVFLQRCDRTNLWTGSNTLTVDMVDKKEGIASLKFNGAETDWFAKTFSQVYSGVDETGYLSFWLYVSDPAYFDGNGYIEISSSGGTDTNKYTWDMSTLGLTSGWNELVLPISSAMKTGSPDLKAINYFRVYQNLSGSITVKLDDIRFLKTASPEISDDPLDIQPIDFQTLDGKVMFGYQGWFLHPDDGSVLAQWRHWGGDMSSPEDLTVDMFPDFREYEADELFPTGDNFFSYPDGRPARVYSAYKKKTVVRHMKWVRDYGLDGVFLQRFLVSTTDESFKRSRDSVTSNIMDGCEKYGRAFANMWDLSGFAPGRTDYIINDWKHLVDNLGITESPNYLYHRGLPLVSIWGFTVREEFPLSDLKKLLDFFESESTPEKYRASVMLGVDHDFHERSAAWLDELSRADVISPWAVGRFRTDQGQQNFMNSHVLPGQDWCDQNNVDFLPVIWPGFSWANNKDNDQNKIPREGGDFFWKQATRVISGNAKSIYIAMFDEIDESTAMYKLAENKEQAPAQGYWLTLDADGFNLPSDWYLRCAKLATEIVRGNTDNRTSLGTPPDGIDQFSVRTIAARCGETNGKLILEYPHSDAEHLYEFSIDNGLSYPYISPVETSEISVQGLPAGIYNVWVRNEDDSNPVDLGPYTIFDTEPFADVSPVNATCNADGRIIFQIKDLPYAGEVEISIDSGMNYIYASSPGIWKDTISGLDPGDYPVWIRYLEGECSTELVEVSITSNLKPIDFYPILDGVQIPANSDTIYTCPESSLVVTSFPADSDLDWSITGPHGFTSSSRNSVISNALTPEMFGTYEISYSRPDGCHSSTMLVLLQSEGCTTSNTNTSLSQYPARIYPNPVNEEIIIETQQSKTVRLEIWSADGHLVLKKPVVKAPATISLNSLSQGIYVVKLYNEFGAYQQRLVKQ